MTTTTESKMNQATMNEKIAAVKSFEALAVLCQAWAAEQGIELTGTYKAMAARSGGSVKATFAAFAARARTIQKAVDKVLAATGTVDWRAVAEVL